MADQHRDEGASTSEACVGSSEPTSSEPTSSESTVELNIKMLDSQIFTFQVDKNMPVSLFKEKIADKIDLPVGQQRLIFRGKVLKDDHLLSEYHVENGHTLHLVARHPSQSQAPSGASSEESNTASSRGQDATGGAPRGRIGPISHSVVLGTLNVGDPGEGMVPDISRVIGAVLNSFGIGSQTATNGIGIAHPVVQVNAPAQATQGNETEGTQSNAGMQNQSGSQAHPGQTFLNQSSPQVVQIPLGAAISVPSLNAPIPDSLSTLLEFMTRMEQTLSQNGYQSPAAGDAPTTDLPTNARGFSSPDGLSIILRHAQHLLGGQAVAALSHVAGRLEQEGDSVDPNVRSQIQTESMQVGVAVQHLGALFLELGRVMLTLRMGQSPAESIVNSGPAVYVSPTGPNPIMVQPFPLQTSSLFGGSATTQLNTGPLPVGIGNIPRHVNIHIHTAVGTRAINAEGIQGERLNGPGVSVSEVNSRIRNLVDNMQSENQISSGESANTQDPSPSVQSDSAHGMHPEHHQPGNFREAGGVVNSEVPSSSAAVPLGLGLGGLQPKKRSKQPKSQAKSNDDMASNAGASSQNQQTSSGQQILQSLASLANRTNANNSSSGQLNPTIGRNMENVPLGGGQGVGGQFDVASTMSQVLQSPALNGLLAGVSEQTGIGSPNVLRSMLEQLTQSPEMRNTVNQIAQQVETQDPGNMFSGLGRGQGGGFDLSRMVQQMMPIVSQALNGGSNMPMAPGRSSRDENASGQTSQIDLRQVVQRLQHQSPPEEIFRSMVENAAHLYDNGADMEDLVDELCQDEDLAIDFMQMLRLDVSRRLQEES